ncbi:MAG TPA: class I SAM-dependent methyltransferase, partial [Ilumatobacteraceae bacterium]
PNEPQRAWVGRLLDQCPAGGVVLDAPCGTGRYFELVTASDRRVVGIDQSAAMLDEARARGLATEILHLGLQEMSFVDEFDAAMTIDAMENVAPEDWPVVLANLRRSVRPGGHLYLTVEEDHGADFEATHRALIAKGVPALIGEVVEGDVASYHYYPTRDQVLAWFTGADLVVVDEAYHAEDGWGYRHFLLRRPS